MLEKGFLFLFGENRVLRKTYLKEVVGLNQLFVVWVWRRLIGVLLGSAIIWHRF